MHEVWTLKYRPKKFADVVGQLHVVSVLTEIIKTRKIPGGFVFSGSRGTSKTTQARIVAKALNCVKQEVEPCGICESCVSIDNGASVDVLEIDAASSNSVDDIRKLKEWVGYKSVGDRHKVIILDEAHQLSSAGFNALLKTLEEATMHSTLFILCSTEVDRIPATIVSRCMIFEFRRIEKSEIIQRLAAIVAKESRYVETEVLEIIAAYVEGGMRDAISILEQVCMFGGAEKVTVEHVKKLLGLADHSVYEEMVDCINCSDASKLVKLVEALEQKGVDYRNVLKGLVSYLTDLLLLKVEPMIFAGRPDVGKLKKQAEFFARSNLNTTIYLVMDLLDRVRRNPALAVTLLRVGLLVLCKNNEGKEMEEVSKILLSPSQSVLINILGARPVIS